MIRFKTIRNYFTALLVILLSDYSSSFAQIKSYQKTNFGVSFILNSGRMNIYLIKDGLVEVKYTRLENMPEKKSLVVEPVASYLKDFSVKENKDNIIITTGELKIKVNRENQAI